MFVNMFWKICVRMASGSFTDNMKDPKAFVYAIHSPFLFRLKLRRRAASPQYRCHRFQGYAKKIEARRSGFDLQSRRDNAIK